MRIFVSSHASVRTPIGRKANLFSFWGSFRSPTARMLAPTFVQNTLKMCFSSGVARIWRWGTAGLGDGSHTAGSRGCQTTHNFVYLAIVHSQFLSGTQRAAQTVLGVYLKLTCSRVTSATSAFWVLSDYALYKSTHSLTHSLMSHNKKAQRIMYDTVFTCTSDDDGTLEPETRPGASKIIPANISLLSTATLSATEPPCFSNEQLGL